MNKYIDPTTNPYEGEDEFYDRLNERRREILKQAEETGTGFIQLKSKHHPDILKEEIFVPRRPFERWAIGRSNSFQLDVILPWDNICPSGTKMINDCEDHSDWWIGAGLDIDAYYNDDLEDINTAAYSMKREIQRKLLNFDKMVLTNAGKVTGRIKLLKTAEDVQEAIKDYDKGVTSYPDKRVLDGDIIVIPHAGIEFEEAFRIATKSGKGGVVTVIPNKVAHLCKLAREQDVTIMCDPDAFETYRGSWNEITLDPDKGKIVGVTGQ